MSKPRKLTRVVRGKRPPFFPTFGEDLTTSMIMVLAQEVCVLRTRLDAATTLSAAKGGPTSADIDAYVADDRTLARQEAWRQDLLDRMFYLLRQRAAEAATGDSSDRFQQVIDDIARG